MEPYFSKNAWVFINQHYRALRGILGVVDLWGHSPGSNLVKRNEQEEGRGRWMPPFFLPPSKKPSLFKRRISAQRGSSKTLNGPVHSQLFFTSVIRSGSTITRPIAATQGRKRVCTIFNQALETEYKHVFLIYIAHLHGVF